MSSGTRHRYQSGGGVPSDRLRITTHAGTRFDERLSGGETPRIERTLKEAVTAPPDISSDLLLPKHSTDDRGIRLGRIRAGKHVRDVVFVTDKTGSRPAVVTCYPVSLVSGRRNRRTAREFLDDNHGQPTEARHG